MYLTIWHYIGITILILDIIWIVFYYYYATVKVYNFHEGNPQEGMFTAIQKQKKYQYLGYLWVRKRQGEYYLKIPVEMIENSVTTKYKITSQSWFHMLRKGEKMHISFADQYMTEVKLDREITVKNYIATSHQL